MTSFRRKLESKIYAPIHRRFLIYLKIRHRRNLQISRMPNQFACTCCNADKFKTEFSPKTRIRNPHADLERIVSKPNFSPAKKVSSFFAGENAGSQRSEKRQSMSENFCGAKNSRNNNPHAILERIVSKNTIPQNCGTKADSL